MEEKGNRLLRVRFWRWLERLAHEGTTQRDEAILRKVEAMVITQKILDAAQRMPASEKED